MKKRLSIILLLALLLPLFLSFSAQASESCVMSRVSLGTLSFFGNPFRVLLEKGAEIFVQIRTFAFILSAFGLVSFSINALFGNINWQWFSGIILSLMFAALLGALVDFLLKDSLPSESESLQTQLQDTL
ncbi:MAG: hypothetical protein EOM53_01080 [Alphaproteobacteria bacterium]|nr:hypothetical protein [Alphaproteobacteria bacterium]